MKPEEYMDECLLIGQAIISAQVFEFALYGVVSHLSDDAKKRRFKEITPEKFLRGNPDELKATLGQLVHEFGEELLITNDELVDFIERRNLIAHNYWRLTHAQIKDAKRLGNPQEFLTKFIKDCEYWKKIAKGLVYVMMEAIAIKQGKVDELKITKEQKEWMNLYREHAIQTKNRKGN